LIILIKVLTLFRIGVILKYNKIAKGQPLMNAALINQLPKALRVKEELKKDILSGKFGVPGDYFISVRAIADTRGVSLKTAQRIMMLLKEDGFVVLKGNKHILADTSRLAHQQSNVKDNLIGLVVTNLENPFFAILAKEVELAAGRAGFKLMMASSNYDFQREKEIIGMFQNAGVAGIIICPVQDDLSAQYYASLHTPYILVGRRPDGSDADAVLVHNFNAGRMVANHFVSNHYRNFGYFGLNQFHPNPRFSGYIAELEELGYGVKTENIVKADPKNFDDATPELKKMLTRAAKPVAIFCFHDLLAAKLLRVCRELKLKIPDDVGICGFDNLPVASAMMPSLTTVAYPISDMAQIAVERLKRKISNEDNSKQFSCFLEPNLVIRESTEDIEAKKHPEFATHDYAYQLV